jgi:probable HAF family extracellular repeat protein
MKLTRREIMRGSLAALAFGSLRTGRAGAQGSYGIVDLGDLCGGDGGSTALDINDAGQVVGATCVPAGGALVLHAFLWRDGDGMKDLGTLGGASSEAVAISATGQVVGLTDTADGNRPAFRWRPGGGMADLGHLGGGGTAANDINAQGRVTGISFTADGLGEAFLTSGDGPIDPDSDLLEPVSGYLGAARGVNDAGQVVGSLRALESQGMVACSWKSGAAGPLEQLSDTTSSEALAINNAGQIVGVWGTEAVLWDGSARKSLGTLPGARLLPSDINDAGQVVGAALSDQAPYRRAFLYENGQVVDLSTLLTPGSGWELLEAAGINKQGQIVGVGRHPDFTFFRAFLLLPR